LSEETVDERDPIPLKAIASTLRRTIHNAWFASLSPSGNRSPLAEVYNKRATNPQIGDMVAEISTISYRERDLKGVGILVDIADEPIDCGDYDWDEEVEGRPRPTERVFYIKALDGSLHRWLDAEIIAAVSGPLRVPALTDKHPTSGYSR